jgi:hypothetical protein
MAYRGTVKGNWVELEKGATLPEGARVRITLEDAIPVTAPGKSWSLREWLRQAREVRAQLPETSDSVEILRQLREGRASR